MGGRWNSFGFELSCLRILFVILEIVPCKSLNLEGLALLEFRSRVDSDPYGIFANWNPNDCDPCLWFGVHCVNTRVQSLDLNSLSLKGNLPPELGKLTYLKSLILYKNHFSGTIPNEIGALTMLELLDLRDNEFSGTLPAEIDKISSLNCLLLCNNKFEGRIPIEVHNLNLPLELQCDGKLCSADSTVSTGIGCVNRKIGHCVWQRSLKQINKDDFFTGPIKEKLIYFFKSWPMFKFAKRVFCGGGKGNTTVDMLDSYTPNPKKLIHGRLLVQQPSSSNLEALRSSAGPSGTMISHPISRSSGAFPAVSNTRKKELWFHTSAPMPSAVAPSLNKREPKTEPLLNEGGASPTSNLWKYAIVVPCVFLVLLVSFLAIVFMCRRRGVTTIGPWKTGLSGQLQKAFVTGVPKLNRSELETACEDFSNIIDALNDCTVYKGTLSSGLEIAVASSSVKFSKDWSKRAEMAYRKKIDTLSRVNHKNFVNLLGYCEEDEPFNRMMVFEYAPNGTLFEHLHVKEMEHLDWNARTRIVMGIAYCLQCMHHDLSPPVSHPNLISSAVFLTDDYAAKIGEISFSALASCKYKNSAEDVSRELLPFSDPETNVYNFGVLLFEIISGKAPYSKQHGSFLGWAGEYLNETRNISEIMDPTLKSFKDKEVDVICEVIEECVQREPRHRPTMKEIVSKLRSVIPISPDAATPRLSPLWWAELEILSGEAS